MGFAGGAFGGKEYVLFLLAEKAVPGTGKVRTCFALQHRHPDGNRWLDVGHFATRDIAKLALRAFVADGHGEEKDFRVKKVTPPPGRP